MIKIVTICTFTGLLLAMGGGKAQATSFCPVDETRDGFAALRAGPFAEARLVARMKAGDEVRLAGSPQGPWQQVEWWRGDERLQPPGRKARAGGWVNRRLIGECG